MTERNTSPTAFNLPTFPMLCIDKVMDIVLSMAKLNKYIMLFVLTLCRLYMRKAQFYNFTIQLGSLSTLVQYKG